MTALFPNLFSRPKSGASTPKRGASAGWQRSGPELKREGTRKETALTSIHNISRKTSEAKQENPATSSIARAMSPEGQTGKDARTHDSAWELREADEKRHNYIRRLVKERQKREEGKENGKKNGLFF
jgi:hypothetical protein